MSFINWGSETPEQKAFRKKVEEQEFFQQAVARKLFEQRGSNSAATAASAAGAGAPLQSTDGPSSILESGKCQLFVTYDEALEDMVFRVANYDVRTISAATPVGVGVDTNSYYYEIIDGKGFLLVFDNSEDDNRFLFIDAGGNLIKTVHLDYVTDWSTRTSDGLAVSLRYFNRNGVAMTFHWWTGAKIGTKVLNNPGSITVGFLDDDTFADGTLNLRDDNGHGYFAKPDGRFINVTSKFSGFNINNLASRVSRVANYTMLINYDGVKYDKLRALTSDGTVLGNWDISSYLITGRSTGMYGSDKYLLVGTPDNPSLSYLIMHFDGTTMTTEEIGPVSTYTNYSRYRGRIGGFTLERDSKAGAENAVLFFHNDETRGGTLKRYGRFTAFWMLDGTPGIQSNTFLIGPGQTFGLGTFADDVSKTPTYIIQAPGATNPAIMFLTPTGVVTEELPLLYADLLSQVEVQPFSELTMVLWGDSLDIEAPYKFNVYDGMTLLDTAEFSSYTTWYSNRDTFIVTSEADGIIRYWNLSNDAWQTVEATVNNAYYADFKYDANNESNTKSTQWNSIDSMYSGTTFLALSEGNAALLTSNSFAFIQAPNVEWDSIYVGKDRVYYLYQDGINWEVSIYNAAGVNFHTVDTGLPTLSEFTVVSDRAYFRSGSTVIVIYSNGTISTFNVDSANIRSTSNDFAKDDWC